MVSCSSAAVPLLFPIGFPLGLYLLLEMVGSEVLMLLLVTRLVRVVTRLKESV